jgi:hypothetical protein
MDANLSANLSDPNLIPTPERIESVLSPAA